MNFKDKVVIVTGATRGIGKQIATQFASHQATVVCVSRSEDQAITVANELATQYDTSCLGVGVDVANQESVNGLIKQVIDTYQRIDILINNAGITNDKLLLRMNSDDWKSVIQTNLDSVFYTTKAVIRPMLKQKYGRIINMSSVVGVIGNPGQANYAASKAGMIGFSKSIAKEIGAKGITCNVVAPGYIQTDMIDSLPDDYINNIMNEVPLKRLGTAEDVANLTLFLSSDLSSYITGQVMCVDGGIQM